MSTSAFSPSGYTGGMSKAGLITLAGIILVFLPFFGIPGGVKIVLSVILGSAVAVLGFLVREERRHFLRALSGEHATDAYTESGVKSYAEQVPQEVV